MAEYTLRIHHDQTADGKTGQVKHNIGHFYVEFVNNNGDSKFYGLNPKVMSPVWAGDIDPDHESKRNDISNEHHGKDGKDLKFVTKEIPLTKEQYSNALKFAESKQANPPFYLGGGDLKGAQDYIDLWA